MPNIQMMANKAKNFIGAFAAQARRSGQYTMTAARSRMMARGVVAGGTAARSSLRGMGGGLRSDLSGIARQAMASGGSLAFHAPGLIGAGIGAAYGGYNDATGRRGPGIVSGALMGAAGGYGFRASTMSSVRSMGQNLMSNARMAKTAFGRGRANSIRSGLSSVRAGARAGRRWSSV